MQSTQKEASAAFYISEELTSSDNGSEFIYHTWLFSSFRKQPLSLDGQQISIFGAVIVHIYD